jgi:hypothetical protein
MKLTFPKDSEGWAAVANNAIYDGKMCDELLFASINKTPKGFEVVWEDNFKDRDYFNELANAQQFILLSYHKHTPFVNGCTYEIEEI